MGSALPGQLWKSGAVGLFDGLCLHFLLIAALLFYLAVSLRRRRLFHWLSAGFWAWASMCFYFVAVPMFQWYQGGSDLYLKRLYYTEGLPRLVLITGCIVLGGAVFFYTYFRTRPGRGSRLNLPPDGWPGGTWLVLFLSLLGAAYSLCTFRGFFGMAKTSLLIEGGKFTGDTTGYLYVMHNFASFPIVFLLYQKKTRLLGLLLAIFYLLGRLEDSWDRFTIVSLGLSITMLTVSSRRRSWPPWPFLAGLALLTIVLQLRGHTSFSDFLESGRLTPAFVKESLATGPDAAMLPTLWLESYLHDRAGYTYGLSLLAQLAVGPLPRKYFPWKDQVIEALTFSDSRKMAATPGYELLYGTKSTVIGSFYGYGGILGVLLGMALLGFLTRKLDGLVSPQSNPAVQALGFVWLGMYWMIFGSHCEWGVTLLYLTSLPFLLLVLVAKLNPNAPALNRIPATSPGVLFYGIAQKNCRSFR